MKTKNRLLAVILAVVISLLPLVSLSASAVTYPDGVSKTTVAGSIRKLDTLAAAFMNSGDTDIKDTVYSSLCSDKTLNSLFAGVYGEIAGNESTLSTLGINLSPSSLSTALSAYPDVSKKLAACSDLKAAVDASASFVWNVKDREGFAKACAAMFSPFNAVLFTILCSGSIQINNYVSVKGANGYKTSIIPLFEALECPQIMSQEEYTKAATANRSMMVKQIVYMLYYSIDAILDAPVDGLTRVLPHLAWYLQSGKLSETLQSLLSPLSLRIGIFTIPGISSLFSGIADIENSADLSAMLKNVDLSSLTGGNTKLTLPDIDLDALAACGTAGEDGSYTADQADALIVILNWLLDALRQNQSALTGQADKQVTEMLSKLLAKDNATLIKAVFIFVNASDTPRNKMASYTYPPVVTATVTMPEGLTTDDVTTVVNGMDDLITQLIQESNPEGNVEDTLKAAIYSDKVLSTIVTSLYSAIASEEYASVFSLLGLNVNPSAVAGYLSKYGTAGKTLRNASDWSKVGKESLNFGIVEGDRKTFEAALNASLVPFRDILSFVLAADTIKIADAIEIRGTNGYSTVVIPLLEALGCDNQTIVAYSGYAKTESAVISDITSPILSLVDKICASPVEMLCTILPNVVYFLNSGILPDMIKNLIYPVTSLLEDAGLSDLLSDDLFSGLTSQFNLNDIINKADLSSLGDIDIKLPTADLTQFASMGTPETRISKMSANGQSISYTYVVADRPAVLMTILRYLVGALSMEENKSLLSGLISSDSAEGGADMMSMYAGNITQKFEGMSTDEIIVWLYGLLFRETPPQEIETSNEEIPTIIYEPESKITPQLIIGIIFGLIVLAFFVVWILLRLGYLEGLQTKLDKRRHKREKKKQDKQRAEFLKKMEHAKNRTDIIYSSEIDGAGRSGMKESGVKNKTAQVSTAPAPVAKASVPGETASPVQRKEPSAPVSTAKLSAKGDRQPVKAQFNPTMSEKNNNKLAKQQEKAAMKALKDTKKADKYYEKALKKTVKR